MVLRLRSGSRRGLDDTHSLLPFRDDRIALVHRHAGIGQEHLGALAAAPGEIVKKVFLADVVRAGRSINFCLAALDDAVELAHVVPLDVRQYARPTAGFSTAGRSRRCPARFDMAWCI